MVILCDAGSFISAGYYYTYEHLGSEASHITSGDSCRIGWWHSDGANILFVDGHVGWFNEGIPQVGWWTEEAGN